MLAQRKAELLRYAIDIPQIPLTLDAWFVSELLRQRLYELGFMQIIIAGKSNYTFTIKNRTQKASAWKKALSLAPPTWGIDVPLFETLVAFVMVEHLYGESFVPAIGKTGYERLLNPHRKPYKTKDGYLAVLPYTDDNWKAFFTICLLQYRVQLGLYTSLRRKQYLCSGGHWLDPARHAPRALEICPIRAALGPMLYFKCSGMRGRAEEKDDDAVYWTIAEAF